MRPYHVGRGSPSRPLIISNPISTPPFHNGCRVRVGLRLRRLFMFTPLANVQQYITCRGRKSIAKWWTHRWTRGQLVIEYAIFIGFYRVIIVAWGAKGHEFKSRPSDHFSARFQGVSPFLVFHRCIPLHRFSRLFTPSVGVKVGVTIVCVTVPPCTISHHGRGKEMGGTAEFVCREKISV